MSAVCSIRRTMPRVAEFFDNLDRVNAAAERMPGFVWRLKDESGNATSISAYDDPAMLVNMSVWESAETFETFVWQTVHANFYRRRDRLVRTAWRGRISPCGGSSRAMCRRLRRAGRGWSISPSTARASMPSAGRAWRRPDCGANRAVPARMALVWGDALRASQTGLNSTKTRLMGGLRSHVRCLAHRTAEGPLNRWGASSDDGQDRAYFYGDRLHTFGCGVAVVAVCLPLGWPR